MIAKIAIVTISILLSLVIAYHPSIYVRIELDNEWTEEKKANMLVLLICALLCLIIF